MTIPTEKINRREAIKKTSILIGGSLSAAAIFGVMHGCIAEPKGVDWEPKFFSKEQANDLSLIVDRIIPATDTPGAVEVGVPEFIDEMLQDIYNKKQQINMLDGFIEMTSESENMFDKTISKLDSTELDTLLSKFDKEAYSVIHGPNYDAQNEKPAFSMIKELTLLGFFTSEIGMTQVLQYDPIPGNFDGCIPLDEIGTTWAT